MKINIYYGGRGLIEDSTLYVLTKITSVLEELRVDVRRYNLYENKNEIATLPSMLKDADGVILAANVEWFGIGGLLQQFLDSCWLYGDRARFSSIYMMPVVISNTYGEREAETTLQRAWELLGGVLCPGICAYVHSQTEFETNPDYAKLIEKKSEDLYRTIKQKPKAFPGSTASMLQDKIEPSPIKLTPQESEQLSKYVSDDTFVKKQKEDIEELSEMFTSLMDTGEAGQEFIKSFKEHFKPVDETTSAVFEIRMTDTEKTLVAEVNGRTLKCYYGNADTPTVIATTSRETVNRIVNGRQTFQGAFMTGALTAKGDFKVVRMFDRIFEFSKG